MSSQRGGRGAGEPSSDGPGSKEVALRQRLEAEDPDTDSLEIARLWVQSYDELVAFEERILARLNELLPTLSGNARHEAELTNLPMVVQHLQTFRYRRAHWRQRLQELDGR